MAELVDAPDSKSGSGNRVWVRFPLPAPSSLSPYLSERAAAILLSERRILMTAWGDYLAGREVTRADGSKTMSADIFQFPAPQSVRSTLPPTVGARIDEFNAGTSPM